MENEALITVFIDSGANVYSKNVVEVSPEDLGFQSKEKWDAATNDEKNEAVAMYFREQGYPEYGWE